MSFDVEENSVNDLKARQETIKDYREVERAENELNAEANRIRDSIVNAGMPMSQANAEVELLRASAIGANPDNPAQWLKENLNEFVRRETIEDDAYNQAFRMSKKAKAEYAAKMREVDDFVKANNIRQAQNGKSFYFELNGQKYRVSNHTVEASNAGAFNAEGQQVRDLYHPDGRGEEVQIFASPTRIIDIYNAIKDGKQVDGRGRVVGQEYKQEENESYIVQHSALRQANTFEEAKKVAQEFVGKKLVNSKFGMEAIISNSNIDKMKSGKATSKSADSKLQIRAIANVDKLFVNADVEYIHKDKNNNKNIQEIHRMFSPFLVDGKPYIAKLTVKVLANSKEGNRVYSVEALEIKDASRKWNAAYETDNAPLTSFPQETLNRSINQFLEKVNSYKESIVKQNNNAYNQKDLGAISWDEAGRATIALFPKADASTLIHESGHFFFQAILF